MIDYYNELDIDYQADDLEIREKINNEVNKWRKRVNAPDPQRQRMATERMELLQEAEEILLNPSNRLEYDKAFQQQTHEPIQQNQPEGLNEVESLLQEVDQLLNQKNIADAIVVAKKATEVDASHPHAWATLAHAHFMWGEIQDALYEIKRAIQLVPNNDYYYYILYLCQTNRNDMQLQEKVNLAGDALNKALHIAPNNPIYIAEDARLAYDRNDLDYAINRLKTVEQMQGLEPEDRNLLADIYYTKAVGNAYRVNYTNGEVLYYFIDKQSSLKSNELLLEAKKYVNEHRLQNEIQKWINVTEDAFKMKNNFKVLAWLLLIVPSFVICLMDFEFLPLLILGGLGFLVWKKGRVPQYELNRRYINTLN